jgi:hypothetical protein
MLVHPDDLEEQIRNRQVVTTMLEAVPLVLEANGIATSVASIYRGWNL